MMNFLRNLHTVFHRGCTLPIPTSNAHVSSFSTSLPNTCLLLFLIRATITDVKRYLLVVLICIFLTICDVEHLFMSSLAIALSSEGKGLFKFFCHL